MKNILLALTLCGAAGIGYAAWFAPANLFDSNEVSHAQVVSEHLQRQSLQEVKAAVSSYTTKAELETAANKLYTTLWGGNWGFNCRPQILGLGADDIVGGSVAKRHYAMDELKVDAAFEGDVKIIWQDMYALIKECDLLMETIQNSTTLTKVTKYNMQERPIFLKRLPITNWFVGLERYRLIKIRNRKKIFWVAQSSAVMR